MKGTLEERIKVDAYKSAGEKAIAGFLSLNDIPFDYEKPTLVLDCGRPKIWYPDFCLSEYSGIIVEYFGLAGSSRDYDQCMRHKLAVYDRNRIRVVSVMPEHFSRNVWARHIMDEIGRSLDSVARNFGEKYNRFLKRRQYQ